MPNRFRKALLSAGGIALLVFAIVFLVVPRLLSGDLIRDGIIRETERATGAVMTLGEARLQWRWGWRIILRDGTIKGTGAALAAATGSSSDLDSYAAVIGELVVEPAMLPLLSRQLVVKSVRLTGPRLDLDWKGGGVRVAGFDVGVNDLNLDLGVAEPAGLALAFTAAADTLGLPGFSLTGVEAAGGFADLKLAVEELSAHWSSGIVKGSLTLDYSTVPGGHLDFQAEVEGVPAGDLLRPWAPGIGDRLECEMDASGTGGLDLGSDETMLRTLDVAGHFQAGPGVLHAADWLRDISRYLGPRQDLKDIRFRDLHHRFRMVEGRYQVPELVIEGGDTDWRCSGWLEPAGAIALDIDLRLPPGFTPELGNWSFLARSLRDSEGRINLPLKLSGRTANPVVGVDLGRLRSR